MQLHCIASSDGGLKLDKDGNSILSLHIDTKDLKLEMLAYFHLRPDTTIHILGNKKDVIAQGHIQEINIKSEVTAKFCVLSKVDLNAVHALCKDPESWHIRFADEQTDLREFAQKLIEEYGEENAKTLVKVASDWAKGEASGKTYNINVEQ